MPTTSAALCSWFNDCASSFSNAIAKIWHGRDIVRVDSAVPHHVNHLSLAIILNDRSHDDPTIYQFGNNRSRDENKNSSATEFDPSKGG